MAYRRPWVRVPPAPLLPRPASSTRRRPPVPQPLRLVHGAHRRRRGVPRHPPRQAVRPPRPGPPPVADRRRRRMIGHVPADRQPVAAIELVDVVKSFGSSGPSTASTSPCPRARSPCCSARPGRERPSRSSTSSGSCSPRRGSVIVEGKDLAELTEAELYELRRGMSAVLQGTLPFTCGLFYSLNVYENVAFALRARTRLSPEQVDQVTLAHLDMVGLRDRANAMPDATLRRDVQANGAGAGARARGAHRDHRRLRQRHRRRPPGAALRADPRRAAQHRRHLPRLHPRHDRRPQARRPRRP